MVGNVHLKLAAVLFFTVTLNLLMAGVMFAAGPDRRIVEGKTMTIAALADELGRSGASGQPSSEASLMEAVRQRQALLAQLVETDPAAVLAMALPAKVRDNMPPAIRAMVEAPTELEGAVEVLTQELEGHCSTSYYLTGNGRRYKLHFSAAPPSLTTGNTVRVRGVALGGDPAADGSLVIDPSLTTNVLIMGSSSGTISGNGVPIPTNTFGEQKVLVFLVNFPGNQTQPWTVEDARTMVSGVPNAFYQENSSGQTWLTVDVAGWFTIPVDVTAPSPSLISYYARQAATNAGFNLSAYNRYIYAFPAIGNKIGNQGSVGGTPSETWLEGTLSVAKTVTHELGHNLGLAHSHSLESGSQVFAPGGTSNEYGDVLDVMGNTATGHFTAFQKQCLGWLDYGSSPQVTHVAGNGSYTIAPYAAAGSGVKALQIPQGVDPVSGKPVYFYVESRQAVGTDSWLTGSSYASALSGLAVHIGTEGDYTSSYLLDMTPQSQTMDWYDPALPSGRSYTDPASGVTITANAVGTTGASVGVSFSQPVCVSANPSLSITPAQGPWVGSGTTVNYTVTVVNADSPACAAAAFNLSTVVPAGWLGSFSQNSLSLAPGASGSAILSVKSATGTADGFYPISAIATNNALSSRTATISATYVVNAASANHAPALVADNATTATNTTVVIPVLANDSDPDGNPLTVTSVTQGASGTATINSNNTVTYTPNRRFSGSDTFSYSVSDGRGGSATAVVSVTVGSTTTSTKTGGKH